VVDVETEALSDTLADLLALLETETLGNTLTDVKTCRTGQH